MSSKALDRILQEEADKQGLPLYVVTAIWASQFEFIRKTCKESKVEELKVIMLPRFGKFHPGKLKVEKRLKNLNKDKDEREELN
jgi:hypothetical protein